MSEVDQPFINQTTISSGSELNKLLQPDYQGQLNYDQALERVGGAHRYQKLVFIYFFLEWVMASFILLGQPYLFQPPDCTCPENAVNCGSTTQDCYNYACDNNLTEIMFSYYPSVVQQFGLVCSKSMQSTVGQSMTYAGSFLGLFVFPFLADKFGRLPSLLGAWACASLGVIFMCFSFNYWFFVFGFTLAGFGINPAITLHYSFINEHSNGHLREYMSIGVQIGFGVGECLFILLAYELYQFTNWQALVIYCIMIPTVIMNFPILYMKESPKFLWEKNRTKAVEALNYIANQNNRQGVTYEMLEIQKQKNVQQEKTFTVIDLFAFKSLRILSICATIIFFGIQFVYYGVTFTMNQTGFNLYITALIIGLSETAGYSVTDIFIPKLKRKKTVLLGLLLASGFSLVFIPLFYYTDYFSVKIIETILAGMLRFAIVFVWVVVYIFFAEIFPTSVRSLALGFTSALGTVGSFAAPYLVNIFDSNNLAPQIGLAIIGVVAALSTIPMKETFGKEPASEIEELKEHDNEISIKDV